MPNIYCICAYISYFGNFIGFAVDWQWLESFPAKPVLISSNASRSIHLFLAQWRHISSESAVSHVWTMFYQCVITIFENITLCHELHGMFYLWCQMWQELQENCAINAPNGRSSKTTVLVILSMRSLVLHRTAEPQEALWHNTLPKSAHS